jgi:hypothetical protein
MVRKTTYLLLGDRVDLDLLEEGCRRARGRKVGGGRGEVGEEMDLLGLSKE